MSEDRGDDAKADEDGGGGDEITPMGKILSSGEMGCPVEMRFGTLFLLDRSIYAFLMFVRLINNTIKIYESFFI